MTIRNVEQILKYAKKHYPPGTKFHPIIHGHEGCIENGHISVTVCEVKEGCKFIYVESDKIVRLLNEDLNQHTKTIGAGNIYAHGKWAKIIDHPYSRKGNKLAMQLLADIERIINK